MKFNEKTNFEKKNGVNIFREAFHILPRPGFKADEKLEIDVASNIENESLSFDFDQEDTPYTIIKPIEKDSNGNIKYFDIRRDGEKYRFYPTDDIKTLEMEWE